jgi:hypothetical protein
MGLDSLAFVVVIALVVLSIASYFGLGRVRA